MSKKKKGFFRVSLCLILFLLALGVEAAAKWDLDFKNADLHDVLRALAELEKVNMIIDPAVQGRVTIHLKQLTFAECLNILAAEFGFQVEKSNGVYRVYYDPLRSIKIEAGEHGLSVDLKDAPLELVLAELSKATATNIIYPPEVKERVSLTMYQVGLPELLTILADRTGYELEKDGEFYFLKKSPLREGFYLLWENDLLSLDLTNVPLQELARELTAQTPATVVVDRTLQASVSVFFRNLPLEAGLQLLCRTNNLSLSKEGPQLYRIVGNDEDFQVIFNNNLLSVEANNVEVTRILDKIARVAGIDLLYDQEVRGRITVKFVDLPLERGLQLMLESNNFILERKSGYFYVRWNRNPNIKIVHDEETGLFTLDIINSSLNDVLIELARRADQDIIIYSHVNHNINKISIRGVTFTEALDYVLQGTIYTYKYANGVYVVGDGTNLRPETIDLIESRFYTLNYTNAEYVFNNLPVNLPRTNIVVFKEQNGFLVNGSSQLHKYFQEYLAALDRPDNMIRTEVIRLQHIKAEEALKLIPSSIPKQDLMVLTEANAIAATGTNEQIKRVRNYLEKIDLKNPLILFDVMVVQLSKSLGRNYGLTELGAAPGQSEPGTVLSWGGDSLKSLVAETIFPGSTAAQLVKARLEAMVKDGKAQLWANPQITTLNGSRAEFNVSTRYPRTVVVTTAVPAGGEGQETQTQTRLIEVVTGIKISILPWVSADKDITLEIKPTITESVPDTLAGGEGNPIPATSERSTESTVRVKEGDPVVIGGLIQRQESVTRNKIPILGDLPLIGGLFSNTAVNQEESEFVVIITPYILSGEYAEEESKVSTTDIMEEYSAEFQKVIP
ncbi:type II secretion system protein GspD [Capillibacterium thermochitinicola]|uniref:Secretin/TonB short N-terminal domain-containing protein n=1 Tax=Capillibacterium thermochitinicola TaxID=2699427 RepID=A0A8J6I348_9FIRM|nr:hypothetical protein [Capillibacterium thermochitinicola]MBA2133387.1 hypothetical protein [Capillibacterium thermochitinicola]